MILAIEAEFAALRNTLFDLERGLARQTARYWRPQRYSAFTGEVLQLSDSQVLRSTAAYEAQLATAGCTRLRAIGQTGSGRLHLLHRPHLELIGRRRFCRVAMSERFGRLAKPALSWSVQLKMDQRPLSLPASPTVIG